MKKAIEHVFGTVTVFAILVFLVLLIFVIVALKINQTNNPKIINHFNVYGDANVLVNDIRHVGFSETPKEGIEGITNNNTFPILVRSVHQNRGETTQWIKVLKPKEVYLFKVSLWHAFYIHKNDEYQKLIGFIQID